LSESKTPSKRFWEASKSQVERVPNTLVVSYEQPGIMPVPHWHAQVEVNFMFRGALEYRMRGHTVELKAGQLCLFWGGLPHQVVDTTDDAFFVAIHLPLVHFFRLKLPNEMVHKLTHGATLLTAGDDVTDSPAFERCVRYLRSSDRGQVEHGISELILRIERVRFEPHYLVEPEDLPAPGRGCADQHPFTNVAAICEFIAGNFRHDIDCADIATSVAIHPKYAMNLFKKTTGVTLNEYVNLLRLSYAQALLMQEDTNVLDVAMQSGFRSLSAFNKSFRKMSGKSPSDFRRVSRAQPELRH
jgi:AraC-like DNA-binding protein/quercetin dioxygenase-like cupin family protein